MKIKIDSFSCYIFAKWISIGQMCNDLKCVWVFFLYERKTATHSQEGKKNFFYYFTSSGSMEAESSSSYFKSALSALKKFVPLNRLEADITIFFDEFQIFLFQAVKQRPESQVLQSLRPRWLKKIVTKEKQFWESYPSLLAGWINIFDHSKTL